MKIELTKYLTTKFADLTAGDVFLFSQDTTSDVFMKTNHISINALGDHYNCVSLKDGSFDYADGYDTVYPLHNATLTIS